jgi:hypothetical protein
MTSSVVAAIASPLIAAVWAAGGRRRGGVHRLVGGHQSCGHRQGRGSRFGKADPPRSSGRRGSRRRHRRDTHPGKSRGSKGGQCCGRQRWPARQPVAVVMPTVLVAVAWRRGSTVTRPCLTVIDDQAWTTMANDAGSELLVQLWQLAQQQQRR